MRNSRSVRQRVIEQCIDQYLVLRANVYVYLFKIVGIWVWIMLKLVGRNDHSSINLWFFTVGFLLKYFLSNPLYGVSNYFFLHWNDRRTWSWCVLLIMPDWKYFLYELTRCLYRISHSPNKSLILSFFNFILWSSFYYFDLQGIRSPLLDYSHFVSLPLAIHPQLVEKLNDFQNSIIGDPGPGKDRNMEVDPENHASDDGNDNQTLLEDVELTLEIDHDEEHVKVERDSRTSKKTSTRSNSSVLSGIVTFHCPLFCNIKFESIRILLLKYSNVILIFSIPLDRHITEKPRNKRWPRVTFKDKADDPIYYLF